jgi:ATPase subunit of ABC transporter with duplicated ATPase domains
MAVVGLLLGTAIYAASPNARVKCTLLASLFSFASRAKRKRRRDRHEEEEEDEIDAGKPLLKWKNIELAVETKTKKTKKTISILSTLSGEAKAGRLLAIVGPSGAGKTSLLNALAKRVPRKGARLTGENERVLFRIYELDSIRGFDSRLFTFTSLFLMLIIVCSFITLNDKTHRRTDQNRPRFVRAARGRFLRAVDGERDAAVRGEAGEIEE